MWSIKLTIHNKVLLNSPLFCTTTSRSTLIYLTVNLCINAFSVLAYSFIYFVISSNQVSICSVIPRSDGWCVCAPLLDLRCSQSQWYPTAPLENVIKLYQCKTKWQGSMHFNCILSMPIKAFKITNQMSHFIYHFLRSLCYFLNVLIVTKFKYI